MNKQPLIILALCFVLGIVFQECFSLSFKSVVFILIVSFLSLVSFFLKSLLLIKFRNFFLGIFFFFIGIFLHILNSKRPELHAFSQKETIIFKLNKKLNSNEKNRRYEIVFWNDDLKDSSVTPAILSIPKEEKQLDFLHYYKAKAYVNKVESPINDYQFDYAKYLSRKEIYYQTYLPEGFQTAKRNDLSFTEKVSQKRLEVLAKIDKTDISEKSREFLKGIILADRTEIDKETVSDFSKTGLAHILAISGSHIAVIFGIFYFVFIKLFPARFRKTAIVLSLVSIWIFAAFIGFGNSVVRSCIMLSVYFAYVLLQRKPDFLHSMALAALIILVLDTNQIFDVGFQLSFVAVLGIFWLNQPLLKYLPKPKNRIQTFLVNVPTVTLAAQISTLPLVIYYFHQFSLISILANLIIIPVAEIVVIFSLIMTVFIGFMLNFSWLNGVYDWTVLKVLDLIHWFSDFDSVFFNNIPLNLVEAVLLFAAVYFLRFLIQKFSLKNILNLGFVMLIFFAARLGFYFYHFERDETMVHELFKERAFSIKQKGKVTFWIPENSNKERFQNFVINPYLTSRRTKNVEVKTLPQNTKAITFNGKIYKLD